MCLAIPTQSIALGKDTNMATVTVDKVTVEVSLALGQAVIAAGQFLRKPHEKK